MHPAHNMLLLDSLYDSQSGGIFLLSEGIKFQGCGAKSILWDPLHVCICTFKKKWKISVFLVFIQEIIAFQ